MSQAVLNAVSSIGPLHLMTDMIFSRTADFPWTQTFSARERRNMREGQSASARVHFHHDLHVKVVRKGIRALPQSFLHQIAVKVADFRIRPKVSGDIVLRHQAAGQFAEKAPNGWIECMRCHWDPSVECFCHPIVDTAAFVWYPTRRCAVLQKCRASSATGPTYVCF